MYPASALRQRRGLCRIRNRFIITRRGRGQSNLRAAYLAPATQNVLWTVVWITTSRFEIALTVRLSALSRTCWQETRNVRATFILAVGLAPVHSIIYLLAPVGRGGPIAILVHGRLVFSLFHLRAGCTALIRGPAHALTTARYDRVRMAITYSSHRFARK